MICSKRCFWLSDLTYSSSELERSGRCGGWRLGSGRAPNHVTHKSRLVGLVSQGESKKRVYEEKLTVH
jgi:hypothetical protein